MSVQLVNYNYDSGTAPANVSGSSQTFNAIGVTFKASGNYVLDNVKFYLYKAGTITGNAYIYLFAISGTPGTSAIPSGSALAVSDPFNVSSLTTTPTLSTFSFSGANRYALVNNTSYIVALSYSGGDQSNSIYILTGATMAGQNVAVLSGGGWTAFNNVLGAQIYGAYNTAPTADFTGAPVLLNAGDSVLFKDASTLQPLSWSWDFGDSNTSTAQNPAHTYTSAGTYTVGLTATNDGGSNTKTRTGYITVVNPKKLTGMNKLTGTTKLTFS